MPNDVQLTNRILRGRRYQADMSRGFVAQENIGNDFNAWDISVYISNLVQGLQFQQTIGAYGLTTTLNIYNKLGGILGGRYLDNVQTDGNSQLPNTQTVYVPVVAGYNSGKIPFATSSGTPALVIDYTTLQSLYGNNPDLSIYIATGGFTGEEQTPPILTYATPGDQTTLLQSIKWDYPVATTGYIRIQGVSTVAGTLPSGGATQTTYTQGALIDAGGGNWYLPLTLATGRTILSTFVNGVQIDAFYNTTYTPSRLYGFANNDTQTIIVNIL